MPTSREATPRGAARRDEGAAAPPRLDESVHEPVVEVRRSRRRARTVSAWREDGRTIVAIPARFTRAQEREWVGRMVDRLEAQERRRRPSDAQLVARATELSRRYLGGRAVATSVRWSSNQGRRWGSCTPSEGTIRISDRVRGMPRWVLDYVLLHELAHLLQPGHGDAFWAELEPYPHTQRARGFLEGCAFTRDGHDGGEPPDEPGEDEPPDESTERDALADVVETTAVDAAAEPL